MRRVTYSMGCSLDGYISGPDGGFDWGAPSEEEFAFYLDELREADVHLLGRRLYETMVYWESDEHAAEWTDPEREWAVRWREMPKTVFSTTLGSVVGNTRLLDGGLVEEIERLRAEPGDGDIAIGGAGLARAAAEADLIDVYRPRFSPVIVGGGVPYFPQIARRFDLELIATRTFASGMIASDYRVVR
ncbi:dihydrofolate reductase family protein [Agromyces seonyuensis]|uniref:Dihydrofolate reductase n=1 Tax=Agromyces seonyuensis TaxID=2662446 RepID=A0A6I4NRU5_9MICO|nr:dihydrofolate reductase family protein [Agromyces seonyuensis]MWB97198.1 dihydrofolate reductase [Agromyces seonyuensis]